MPYIPHPYLEPPRCFYQSHKCQGELLLVKGTETYLCQWHYGDFLRHCKEQVEQEAKKCLGYV